MFAAGGEDVSCGEALGAFGAEGRGAGSVAARWTATDELGGLLAGELEAGDGVALALVSVAVAGLSCTGRLLLSAATQCVFGKGCSTVSD